MRRNHPVIAVVAAALAGGLLIGDTLAATPKQQLREKRAQAQQILTQINDLDRRMGRTVEAWNGARYRLGKTRVALVSERQLLGAAERQKGKAIARVRSRLVTLYESDNSLTTLAVLLGSSSIGQMIDRLDAARVVAASDHRLAVETEHARARYAAAARRLQATELRRAAAFAQLDAKRRQIDTMLSERKQLLSHVQSQVTALQAAEARRQALLEAQARARLAAQAAERRKQEEATAAAALRAKQQQAARAPAPTTTTTAPAPPAPTTTTQAQAPPATTTTTSSLPPVAAPATGHPDAASIALHYLGVPYLWGGASPSGFDCSGLVMYVYAQLGISLPHFAAAQYGFGTPVSRDQLEPGDLVFFDGLDHVGIYIGGDQMVHAPHTGDVVRIASLADGGSYVGARRL